LTLRSEPVTTVVEGRETVDGVETLRVTEEEQGVRSQVWLTDDGRAVREEAMLGLILRAEPRDAALGGLDGAAPLDVATIARIPLHGTIASPRTVAALTLRVSGPAAGSVPDDPPRQRMRAGVLRIAREPSPVPSAREVLRVLRGDCNEHAVLLTALARAAGIPARMVAGAVYLDGAFLYHAWSELWLGRWVSADAVFEQMPADATHVKLLEGGPERHLGL